MTAGYRYTSTAALVSLFHVKRGVYACPASPSRRGDLTEPRGVVQKRADEPLTLGLVRGPMQKSKAQLK